MGHERYFNLTRCCCLSLLAWQEEDLLYYVQHVNIYETRTDPCLLYHTHNNNFLYCSNLAWHPAWSAPVDVLEREHIIHAPFSNEIYIHPFPNKWNHSSCNNGWDNWYQMERWFFWAKYSVVCLLSNRCYTLYANVPNNFFDLCILIYRFHKKRLDAPRYYFEW